MNTLEKKDRMIKRLHSLQYRLEKVKRLSVICTKEDNICKTIQANYLIRIIENELNFLTENL